MYKENIVKFASEQVVTVNVPGENDYKRERKQGDVSKWFGETDTIEFDDSAEAFLNIKESTNILEAMKILDVKVFRNSVKVDLKKESMHCVSQINKCIMNFFVSGS